jgi:hypothetical protein
MFKVNLLTTLFFLTIVSTCLAQNQYEDYNKKELKALATDQATKLDSLQKLLELERKNATDKEENLQNNIGALEQKINDYLSLIRQISDSLQASKQTIQLLKLAQEKVLIQEKLLKDSISNLNAKLVDLQTVLTQTKLADSSKTTATCSGFSFWNIGIGASLSDISSYLKKKKSQGVFTKLDLFNDFETNDQILRADGQTTLDNILTYKCESVQCWFDKNKKCNYILIQYAFKADYPADLFTRLVADMEKYFKVKATTKIIEDEIGNRTKEAILKKDGVIIKIKDHLDGDFAIFAPKIGIFCETDID